MEISLDGNREIEVALGSISRQLRERYYIGGRKAFGNLAVYPPTGQPFVVVDTGHTFSVFTHMSSTLSCMNQKWYESRMNARTQGHEGEGDHNGADSMWFRSADQRVLAIPQTSRIA